MSSSRFPIPSRHARHADSPNPLFGAGAWVRDCQAARTDLEVRVQVNQGSLYPALQRLEQKGWLNADWKQSETGREAKFYSLTRSGQKQLHVEKDSWARLAGAVQLIFDEGTAQ